MGPIDADDDSDDLLTELLTYTCPLSGTLRTAGAPNHGPTKNLSIYIYRFSLAINTKKQHDTTVCFVLISFDQRLCQILLETTKVVQFQPRGR